MGHAPRVVDVAGDLDGPQSAARFIRELRYAVERQGYQTVTISIGETGRTFPNATVPMAAAVAGFRRDGIDIDVVSRHGPLEPRYSASFALPREAATAIQRENDVFSRVWSFDSMSAGRLAEWIVERAQERLPFREGAFEAFSWSLWEVMDNVLQHSDTEVGFVEAQVHPATRHLAVCIADHGRGALASLTGRRYQPRTDVDALTLAIGERVTRDEVNNQGNGLWGLTQIVHHNNGRLRIASGHGWLAVDDQGHVSQGTGVWQPAQDAPGMTVDFQLDVGRPIDLPAVLGHRPIVPAVERFENPEGGGRILVREHSRGTGTRTAGGDLRVLAKNVLTEQGPPLILDFLDVPIVSSSFADDLVGKLAEELGFVQFVQTVQLANVADSVRALIDRSVALRLSGPEQ